jgi:hypothetical protein
MPKRLVCWSVLFICVALGYAARAEEPRGANLPLKRVVLFSSGVGFFERSGKVQDDAKVQMKFKESDINDLLKSMVVQDLDGGRVSTITYNSIDPITKTLEGFSVDLTKNPTLAQLLDQVRGERVVLKSPNEMSGVILGVETRKKVRNEHEIIEVKVLNLLTDQGLWAVELDSVSFIKLANEQLDAELRKALAVLASAHANDKKAVELSFLGKGSRRVRVGYIQETPVWKTTYRLVLSDKKPLLQGWAIVENTSDEDWSSVNLTLVSGRPISFKMDLYEPLYIDRPEVELELYGSLQPQTYGQDLSKQEAEFLAKASARPRSGGGVGGGMDGKSGAMGGRAAGKEKASLEKLITSTVPEPKLDADTWKKVRDEPKNPPAAETTLSLVVPQRGGGVQSMAEAGNVGNLFQYKIDVPVSLPRQQSAMLPIVNADVKGEKVSIYNASVQAKHPLYGLKFTNLTDLYLMQGPITVFDGGVYAGDAKIEDLPPGSQRLISYGLDLDTEVAPQSKGQPEELLSVRLLKGTLMATRKHTRATEYTVKNSGKQAKTVLIEYPVDPTWTLVSPKEPAEKTRQLYRFRVGAKPGEPVKLQVAEERTDRQQVVLTNVDDDTVQIYLRAKVVSEKVKAALGEVVKRKHELQQIAVGKQQRQAHVLEIGEDQARIRQNMAQLDRNTEVYRNYVKKFSDQEAEIEKLRGQIANLTDQETGLRKALDEFLMGLDLP